MMLFEPTLSLRRLTVLKDNRVVFDTSFHSGVNIVRGHNSSGKTTILDFIAYALGAENIPWKQEALLCDWVIAEVLLNGRAVTLRRSVENKPLIPMYIFWDSYENALSAPTDSWEFYGFRRGASRLSFTQALLLALGLSEAQGDGASNLTMHQLLRVLYADQPSLHSPIFRTDSFDSALNRETIGAYLTGVYDDNLYTAQLNKRETEKEISSLDSELKSIFKVLARSEQNANVESIGSEISHLERMKQEILTELSRLRTQRSVENSTKRINADINLRSELDRAKKALFNAQEEISRGELDVADSRRFIQELELRLRSLGNLCITRFQASQCLNECDVLLPLALKMPAFRGHLAF
ncbi:AAA family ATPase [Comamonas testosteroni]|uniref:AAA family ATPase n=1 Tax=Comamonas testosteroni TaxID=285 RepID=UPI0015FE0C8C|nr:AAA family ATPase [Comamonas testosteroni]